MAPCGWRVQFRLAKRLLIVKAERMGKFDWIAVVVVVFGMLPVVFVAAAMVLTH